MSQNSSITFVVPVLNNQEILEDCLKSIRYQNYDSNKVEIIISDGGSKDKSLAIARFYGCRIIKNPKILAEPGFMLGAENARGELV